ncbi:MAG: hypothetical protein ACYC6Y_22085 [Thermoguttaceae bacterium]
MSDGSWRDEIVPMVRTSQIVVSALTLGPTMFLVVAGVLVSQGAFGRRDDRLSLALHAVLAVALVGVVAARTIVPGLLVALQRRRIAAGLWKGPADPLGAAALASFLERTGDAGRLMGVFQTKRIVAAAMLEGLAFLAIVVFLLTQSLIALAVAVLTIAALLTHIPTVSGVAHWIEDQLALVEQERSLPPR